MSNYEDNTPDSILTLDTDLLDTVPFKSSWLGASVEEGYPGLVTDQSITQIVNCIDPDGRDMVIVPMNAPPMIERYGGQHNLVLYHVEPGNDHVLKAHAPLFMLQEEGDEPVDEETMEAAMEFTHAPVTTPFIMFIVADIIGKLPGRFNDDTHIKIELTH